MVQIRLYRPFPAQALLDALPPTATRIAVLDRTKEPGSIGEPLFLDVVAALNDAYADGKLAVMPRVSGARYGLSSKEFTPGMVAGVFAELARDHPRNRFTVGINDDVSGTSISYDPTLDIEPADSVRAVFFGLGSDGTVGANKNTIKILGAEENLFAQGYFVYDSKKSGSQTVSHLRFGPRPIRASYLVTSASFVGCHQFNLLEQADVLGRAAHGATLLVNYRHPPGNALGCAAPARAAADPGQEHQRLRGRRRTHRPRRRDGRPDQHRPADLLLRDLRSAAAGRGHRQDQGGHRQELRQAGTRGRREKPCGRRPLARGTGPDQDPRDGQRDPGSAAAGAGAAPRNSCAPSPPR